MTVFIPRSVLLRRAILHKTWLLPLNECPIPAGCRRLVAWLSISLMVAAASAGLGFVHITPASNQEETNPKKQPQDEEKTPVSAPDDLAKTDQTPKVPAQENPSANDAKMKQSETVPVQDPKSIAPTKTPKRSAKEFRRPTAPTDARTLADRPPRPEFSRSIKANDSNSFDLTFDDLAFEIKDGEEFRWSMITPEIQEYNGSRITLRGYIRPSFKQRGLEQFIFVRDNQECCFGPGAALFDCVLVKMAAGKGVDYTVRPVTLEGEFYLRKYTGPDGNVWAIFRMKEARLK